MSLYLAPLPPDEGRGKIHAPEVMNFMILKVQTITKKISLKILLIKTDHYQYPSVFCELYHVTINFYEYSFNKRDVGFGASVFQINIDSKVWQTTEI